jgi:hypothetical protein
MLAMAVSGCATGSRALQPQSAGGAAPWQIPPEAFGSQRLYRVSYAGPEGEGTFRVTLRLASLARYQIQAVDPVGRALWGLDVDGGQGVWLDHRNKLFCSFQGTLDLGGAPLGPFPLLSLPSLLLGRIPAEPPAASAGGAPAPPASKDGKLRFKDAAGRSWSADLGADGSVTGWSLSEGGKLAAYWMKRDNWSILSDRVRGVQVRWREVLREPLGGEPAALEKPQGYHEEACRDLYVPDVPAAPPPAPPGRVGRTGRLTSARGTRGEFDTARLAL